MAIIAGGGQVHTAQRSLAVNAAFENLNRLFHRDLMLFDQIDIFMASSACAGKIERIDGGFSFVGRQDIVFAVTVMTGRNIFSILNLYSAVLLVDCGLGIMALAAIDRRKSFAMRNVGYSLVAIGAFHAAMGRSLKD
jgi:hypothetical protein